MKSLQQVFSVQNLLVNGTKKEVKLSTIPYAHHYGLKQKISSLQSFFNETEVWYTKLSLVKFLSSKLLTFVCDLIDLIYRSLRGFTNTLQKLLGNRSLLSFPKDAQLLQQLELPMYIFDSAVLLEQGVSRFFYHKPSSLTLLPLRQLR